MKMLVTGGCGFIGLHLVGRLVQGGHEVTVLDNLTSGKKENLNKAAKLIRGDIRDESDVKKAAKGCEVVFHLAAIANTGAEDAVYHTNFLGSKNVFEAARLNSAKVIFASSAAVYGDTKLCKESGECRPISQYGKSKLKAENILKKQKEYFTARLFNVYGPDGNSVVNKFCGKIPGYKDITVFGNGLQTRDFIHIRDVVDALLLGIENNGLYNVGTGTETSLLQLIDIIHSASGCNPSIRFEVEKKGDIKRSRADVSKIKNELGWQPQFSLQEGVKLLLPVNKQIL